MAIACGAILSVGAELPPPPQPPQPPPPPARSFHYGDEEALTAQLRGIKRLRLSPSTLVNNSKDCRQERFERVYREGQWVAGGAAGEGPRSGSGSTLANTFNVRRAITSLIRRSGVRSILDAPCGDLT